MVGLRPCCGYIADVMGPGGRRLGTVGEHVKLVAGFVVGWVVGGDCL